VTEIDFIFFSGTSAGRVSLGIFALSPLISRGEGAIDAVSPPVCAESGRKGRQAVTRREAERDRLIETMKNERNKKNVELSDGNCHTTIFFFTRPI
jgi:hypothetical protein